MVQIDVSLFGKYNAFFIFHDGVFPTYPENHNIKEGFCFLNRGTKTNSFLLLRLKTISIDPYLILLKQLCCCCLDIRFFLLILIGVSFCNLLQLYFNFMFFFFLCIDMLRIALQLLNVVLNLCVIKNYIVASYLI